MPNGRPGDNPYYDIVEYGIPVFNAEVDDKIRALHAKGTPRLQSLVSDIVWYWPLVDGQPVRIDGLSSVLDAVKAYAQIQD